MKPVDIEIHIGKAARVTDFKDIFQPDLEVLAWTPAIGVDIGPQLAAAILLMKKEELDPRKRAKATLRAAELMRRTEPETAAEFVRPLLTDTTGVGAEASRILAMIALTSARFDEAIGRAKDAANSLPDAPAVKLLLARIEGIESREKGLAAIDALISDDTFGTTWVELAAEALALRARWRAELGRIPEALLDLAALEVLAHENGALYTLMFVGYAQRILTQLHKVGFEGNIYAAMANGLKDIMTEGVPPADIGPMPPWLHGLAFHSRGHAENNAFSKSTLFIAQVLEGAEDLEGAYKTYLWGSQLSSRIDGAEAAVDIHAAFERFRQRVGPEVFADLSTREANRVDAAD